jgi:hypothetical protein
MAAGLNYEPIISHLRRSLRRREPTQDDVTYEASIPLMSLKMLPDALVDEGEATIMACLRYAIGNEYFEEKEGLISLTDHNSLVLILKVVRPANDL